LVFDADGDGHNDLLVTKGGNSQPPGVPDYQPALYLGDGHGGFRAAAADALPSLPNNVGAAVAGDFDHDGRLDVFLGGRVSTGEYPLAPQSALLANRGGKFEDVTDTLAPGLREVGMVTAALWSDVDGDGWLDLLLTVEWGNVSYFHNNQGKGFEDWTERAGFAAAGTGWWTSIAAADFNGDGRPDYVVGNVGLNTQYHADAAHPALLYADDFKGDGSAQLIEAYYEGERVYPWRARRDLGAVFPFITKRFPTNENYARATLGEIFGDAKLAKAQRFAATELRSGVFLSQPDGTYRFEPLPRLAQIAPLQGIVAGDFDGDGHADIYAVQNSYAPIAAVGRFDGGLSQLLRGDGHGHFAAVPLAASGLLVPGDAKALVVLDLDHDGWPDFLVSRNHDETLAFRNHGVAGRHSVRISLRGPAGNPTAVGARVTVELADGSTQTSEVYAGSGYYSQSTAACFFGYPDGNAPRAIRVRWPSGGTTQQAFPAGATSLVLSAP
ncbi:MAG: CRTAC1 family protein, partial [Opitutus sp.]